MQVSDKDQGLEQAQVQFTMFYEREYDAMLRLAVALVDQRARAEELVQDAFERVLVRWDRLANPRGYLRTVLVNASRSELRHRRVVRRRRPERTVTLEGTDSGVDDVLLRSLSRLTSQRRIALVLRFLDDRSEADVAEIMGCRVGTVKSLVSRGLADLRQEYPS